jgi:flagellar biosynthetic protein FliR
MVVTDSEVLTWLGRFVWPFLRITGLFLTAPFYGSTLIPMRVKALLAAALAGALAFWLPNLPAFPGDPITAIYQGIIQVGFGAAIGEVMQIVVASISSLGEVAGLAMGLSFAELQFQDAPGTTQVLYDIMSWAALMGFIAVGGPIWLFAAIAHSFDTGTAGLAPAAWPALLAFGGSPQLNLLTIGFPLLILGGLSILTASLGHLPGSIERLLDMAASTIAVMVPRG